MNLETERFASERRELLKILREFREHSMWPEEAADTSLIEDFIARTPTCFDRDHPTGHITASALVTNESFDRVLLTLHAKLGKWLQLGGHSDSHPIPHEVALKEAQEESGLGTFAWAPPLRPTPHPFDLDIHEIPGRASLPAHLHYDIRYLLVADDESPLGISEESQDLKWWSLEDALKICPEASMQRILKKLSLMRREKMSKQEPSR